MSRVAASLVLAVIVSSGCSSSGKAPTAPPAPPDNPTIPTLGYSVNWTPSPSTIQLTSPDEDLVAVSLWLSASHPPNGGGVQLLTDLAPSTVLHKGVSTAVHVTYIAGSTTPYNWQEGDLHVLRVTVRRPGQSKAFAIELIHD